ncbi:hypothetical protein M011DRAFT_448634 [Sporormia fimetaria CBS 119925]|uniref:FAD-binding FR-type domain-containing protein n=1 Tax=Sporormia fimetaria CBS 119925 TaxID=1340428 RepID=A0A6A6V2N5_9PLEO|nr:hypothetical protein M011DRAFT_448634 [Sporormia fimetaria CBS 119925]
MVFGYAFIDLDDDQKRARRALLDFYPIVAELSALVVLALFQTSFAISWFVGKALHQGRPKSPSFDKPSPGQSSWPRRARRFTEGLRWSLRKPVVNNWGTRGEWVVAAVWTAWLLYLCVVKTGDDYLHLTKRFGIIGASQLPLLYLLAMRSPYSPMQLLTRMSHEELKASHHILGRIIFALFSLHTAFYLNFFVQSGFLAKRIRDRDVIFGLVSIALFSVLSTTALGLLRRWNYRVFYISHIALANVLVVPLFVHVTHIRPYVYQVVGVNAVHLVLRALSRRKYRGTLKPIAGTNLIQVRIPLSTGNTALNWKPGQHVYLSRPSSKSSSRAVWAELGAWCQTNPFTVASIPGRHRELMLVARTMNGNTKHLASLARTLSADGPDEATEIELCLEGPYGASTRLPNLLRFDKILFVAGGVGATFIMPIYRTVVEANDFKLPGSPKVRFIWAVRKLAETRWALSGLRPSHGEDEGAVDRANIEVYVTGTQGPDLQVNGVTVDGDIEMAENEQLLSTEEQTENPHKGLVVHNGRPKLGSIVDEAFAHTSRVAVIVCGPKTMSEQLSLAVQKWVRQGHNVYWHDETFAW